jgi:hypothetical protein
MAGKNTVTLTFAGDTAKLESSFDKVGASAKEMDTKVRTSGEGFDTFGEKIGDQERRWQGLRSSITGTTDTASGFGAIMKGDLLGGSVLVAGGLADLAQGFADTLVPLVKVVATTVAHTTAMVAHAVASKVVRGATLAWAAAQQVLNVAFWMSPIGLVIAAIVVLVAVVVIIATKTRWFQAIWKVAWGAIKTAAEAVWNWLKKVPGWIATAFSKVSDAITKPFKAAFNYIADAWNNTVGALSFHVPSWVPGIGGKGWDVPNIPKFHTGGVVPGAPGSEMLAILQAGERVTPAGGGGATVIEIHSGGSRLDDLLVEILSRAIRTNHNGNVQAALGTTRG